MSRAPRRKLKGVRLAEVMADSDLSAGLLEGKLLQVGVLRRGAVTQCSGGLGCGHDQHCKTALVSISVAPGKMTYVACLRSHVQRPLDMCCWIGPPAPTG